MQVFNPQPWLSYSMVQADESAIEINKYLCLPDKIKPRAEQDADNQWYPLILLECETLFLSEKPPTCQKDTGQAQYRLGDIIPIMHRRWETI